MRHLIVFVVVFLFICLVILILAKIFEGLLLYIFPKEEIFSEYYSQTVRHLIVFAVFSFVCLVTYAGSNV